MLIWCEAWYINFNTILSFEFFIYNNFKLFITYSYKTKLLDEMCILFIQNIFMFYIFYLNARLGFFFLFLKNQTYKLIQQKHPFEINLQIGPFKKTKSNIDSVWNVNHSWIETWLFKAYLPFLIFKYKYKLFWNVISFHFYKSLLEVFIIEEYYESMIIIDSSQLNQI